MTPMHSSDQPDRPASRPVSRDGHRITVPGSYDMFLRDPKLIAVPRADMERFIRKARDLDARSSVWLPAGWGIIGIAVTLGALALQAHVFWLGVLTAILLIGAAGCFKADREFNRRHEDDAEELALEMEEAVDVDNLPIPPGSELGSA